MVLYVKVAFKFRKAAAPGRVLVYGVVCDDGRNIQMQLHSNTNMFTQLGEGG